MLALFDPSTSHRSPSASMTYSLSLPRNGSSQSPIHFCRAPRSASPLIWLCDEWIPLHAFSFFRIIAFLFYSFHRFPFSQVSLSQPRTYLFFPPSFLLFSLISSVPPLYNDSSVFVLILTLSMVRDPAPSPSFPPAFFPV